MATSSTLPGSPPEDQNNPGQEEYEKLTRRANPDDKDNQAAGNPTDPRSNDIASGDSSDPRGAPSREDLSNAEQKPDNPIHENQVGRGYQRGQPPSSTFSLRGRLTKKRAAFGGGIIGTIVAMLAFFIISGPAQMVQLSHRLQLPFSKNDSDSHLRMGRLYRFAKTGDIGETRVNRLGSKIFGSTIDDLKAKGVTISRNSITGRPTKTTIDTNKLEKDFPELKDATTTDRKAFIANKLGVDIGQVDGAGTIFTIDQTDMNVRSASFLNKSTVSLLDKNGLVSAIKTRELSKFFDLPSLFHPMQRAFSDKLNQLTNAAQKNSQAQDEEKQREATLTEPVEAKGATAVDDIKSQSGKYNSVAMKALLFTGGVCFVRAITGDIVTVNHDLVVLPSAIRATDIIAVGEQIQSGQDLNMSQVQTIEEGLNDNTAGGKTIWQGQALDALGNGGKVDPSLTDLPPDYTQAFSGDTTAANIKDFVDKALTIKLPLGIKVDAATYACSPAGIVLQIGGGLFLSISSLIGEVGSGGTLTPGIVGLWTAKEGVSFAISAVAMHFVSSFILNDNTAKIAASDFNGAVGGDLLAYGSRAAANTAAMASGGVALANNASTIGDSKQSAPGTKSIADRLFNPYDSNSVVGKLVQQSAGSPINNISKIGSVFSNFGSMFKNSFASLMPKAVAAQQYNWGFPQYGLPDSLLNDPNLDDPYDNASQVASLLDSAGCATSSCSWISRASACFGVNIQKVADPDNPSSQVWDVLPDHDVNPSDSSYLNANCGDSDENWHRLIMFVFDTTTMKAAACYQGDEQSCTDLSAEGAASQTTDSSSGGDLPQGTAKDLAGQLIPYINSGKISCAGLGGNDLGCSDITNTAKGVSIQGGQACKVRELSPELVGMLLKLAQMGHSFTLSALCTDHSDDGSGGHSTGQAADFNTIDGVFMGPSETDPWTPQKIQAAQKFDQDAASFMPTSTGFGQIQCHPTFDFLNGFNVFNDKCHHQHIQVDS